MTKQSLLFLLICSALFNLFFVAGALMGWDESSSRTMSPRETRLARIAAKLELTSEQQDAFQVLQIEHEEEAELLGDRIREIRTLISTELNKEKPDLDAVDALAREETRLRSERRHASTLRFEEFLQHLDPTQRRALGAEIRRSGGVTREEPMQRMLKDFDADQNGILDEQERRNAESQHEQRKQDRRERREKLRQRFDSDGDGTLSPDEQRALHEFMKQQRDQPPRHRAPGRGRGGSGSLPGEPGPRIP